MVYHLKMSGISRIYPFNALIIPSFFTLCIDTCILLEFDLILMQSNYTNGVNAANGPQIELDSLSINVKRDTDACYRYSKNNYQPTVLRKHTINVIYRETWISLVIFISYYRYRVLQSKIHYQINSHQSNCDTFLFWHYIIVRNNYRLYQQANQKLFSIT